MAESSNNTNSAGLRPGVIGALVAGRSVLMVRRADHVRGGGRWCFPGGHVEPGETGEEAIVREMFEEVGLRVETSRRLGRLTLSDMGYELEVWLLRSHGGDPAVNPEEVAECRWVDGAGARALVPAMPSNEAVLAMLGL